MSHPKPAMDDMIQAPELTGKESWLDPFWEGGEWPADRIVNESTAICILILRDMPYPEYLQTNHWRAVRYRAMRRARWQCQCCPKDAVDADHMTYERRGFERTEDVMALCRECHETKHRNFKARTRAELRQQFPTT